MLSHLKTSWCLWSYAELYLNTLGCHNTISINVAKYDLRKLYLRDPALPFGRQTWQWKMNLLKMYSLLNMGIFPWLFYFTRVHLLTSSGGFRFRFRLQEALFCSSPGLRWPSSKILIMVPRCQNGYGWQVQHGGKMIRERNCYRFLVVKLQLCKSWLIWNDWQLVKHDLYIYSYI